MVNTLRQRGFTVIELLVVLAALAVLLSIVTPRYLSHLDHAREQALRHNLAAIRLALEQYKADRGMPAPDLQALVQGRYLREVPLDPLTERRDTWILMTSTQGADTAGAGETGGGLVDVRSGASGAGRDGRSYDDY